MDGALTAPPPLDSRFRGNDGPGRRFRVDMHTGKSVNRTIKAERRHAWLGEFSF